MKKLFKIFAATIAIIVLLAVTGTTLLGLFIDPNDYKQEIQQAALDNADIELQIAGDISWSIYPSIGLEIQSITASYPHQEPLASLESAQISVMLMPLLSGDVEMKAINIHGLTLNLVKEADSSNWQAASQSGTETEPTATAPETETETESEVSIKKIDIESINITDATITYTDKTTNQVSRLTDFNLTTERVTTNHPFKAALAFKLAQQQNGKQLLSAAVKLEGNFNIDLKSQQYAIKQLVSQLSIVTDQTRTLNLAADINADLTANTLSINNLVIGSDQLEILGKIQASGEQFSQLSGELSLKAFDLKALMQELKLPAITTSNDASLRSIALSTTIQGDATAINFSQLKITLDKTLISGQASYQINSGLIGFNLNGDSIDVNGYLPPSTSTTASTSANEEKTPAKQSSGYSKEEIIPMQLLRDLQLNGQLTFKQLQYQQTQVSNLVLDINANKGLVKIAKINMNVYQGSITNNITLDARKKQLRINIKNSINQLQLGPLLKDFAQTDIMTGTLKSNSQLSMTGQSVHSFVNSLSGKTNLILTKGVINGINAAQEMCETVNKIASFGGIASTTQAVDKSTPFASIKGNFTLKNGVVSNKDFNADLDAINARGKGSVNLAKQSLDYRLTLKIQDNLFNKSCSVNDKIEGIDWPIDCKGNFADDPLKLCKPDLSIIKDIAKKALKDKLTKQVEKKLGGTIKAKKQEFKEKKKEIKQKVEEKVKDELKGLLKGLF